MVISGLPLTRSERRFDVFAMRRKSLFPSVNAGGPDWSEATASANWESAPTPQLVALVGFVGASPPRTEDMLALLVSALEHFREVRWTQTEFLPARLRRVPINALAGQSPPMLVGRRCGQV